MHHLPFSALLGIPGIYYAVQGTRMDRSFILLTGAWALALLGL